MRRFTSLVIPGLTLLFSTLGGVYLFRLFAEVLGGSGPFHGDHHDYLAFYGAAWFTLHGSVGSVYTADAMTEFQRLIIPYPVGAAGYMAFLNPPFYAALFAPLALVGIELSRVLWLILNVALALVCTYLLVRSVRNWYRWPLAIAIIGSYPFYQALIEGQPSLILLTVSLTAILAIKNGRHITGGLLLGVLAIKPQFLALALFGLAVTQYWKVALAACASAFSLVAVTLPITGMALYGEYFHYMRDVSTSHIEGAGRLGATVWQGALDRTSGINGFFASLFGQDNTSAVNMATFIALSLLITYAAWTFFNLSIHQRTVRNTMYWSGMMLFGLLINPHLYGQDVVLLYAAAYLFAKTKPDAIVLLIAIALAHLSVLDQGLKVHLFALATAGIAIALIQKSTYRKIDRKHGAASLR